MLAAWVATFVAVVAADEAAALTWSRSPAVKVKLNDGDKPVMEGIKSRNADRIYVCDQLVS